VVPSRTGVPRRTLRLFLAMVATGLGLLLFDLAVGPARPALAQNTLEESDPADGAVLNSSPSQIALTFTEPIGDANQVSIACGAGGDNDPFTQRGDEVVAANGRALTVEIQQPIPAGRCQVSWQVSEPGGEPGIDGSFSFTVQEPPPTLPAGTGTPTSTASASSGGTADDGDSVGDASDADDATTWLGRVLSTFGVAVLFGALVLIVAAWPEGPEYIVAVRFLRAVWIIALAGTLVYVVALTAAVNDESFGKGLNPSGWLDLLDAGWAGRAAIARLVLVVASGWVVLRPERVIDPTTQLPAIGIPALAAVTLGLSRTGGDWAALGVIAGIAHALAMSIWIGSVVLLARVVLAGPGEEDLVHAVRGFGRISGTVIVVTIVSGLIQLFRLDGGELFSESHGRVLLLKTLLVAAMVFVTLTANQVVQTRLTRASELSVPMADRLRRAFGTQAVLGVGVLALSGWLLALEPGKLPAEEGPDFAISEEIVDEDAGIDLVVQLDPGQVGVNRLRVEVREPETGLDGLRVTFIPPVGSNAGSVVQAIPLTGAGIADSGPPPGGVPLDVAGAWTLQVSASTATGSLTGAGSSFEVRGADGSLPTSDIESVPTGAPVTPAPTTAPPPSSTNAP
jgi:methionine-rich copper-binding protein CopC